VKTLLVALLLCGGAVAQPEFKPAADLLRGFERPVKLQVGEVGGPEAYEIRPEAQGVTITGGSPAAVYYGALQLRGQGVPATVQREEPALRWRGIQLDISRGPVPTLAYLKRVVDRCASLRLNLLGIYMEHTFAFRKHPLLPPPGGALTPEEVRELVAYAAARYVTVLPEQQTFGHMHHLLKHERYADVAEIPHGHVLAPSEKTYQLLGDLYAETVPLFSGPFLHIGADETVELGRGRSAQNAAAQGLGRVYLDHLKRVSELLSPYKKRLIFWGDVAVHHPELLKILPQDAVAMPWNYDAQADFPALVRPFRGAGMDVMVAPGVSNWNRIVPDLGVALPNIRGMLEAGRSNDALGALITSWNDDNEALHEMCWPGWEYGARAAWTGKAAEPASFLRDLPDGAVLQELDKPHALLKSLGVGSASNAAFWLDPFSDIGRLYCKKAGPAASPLRVAAEHALEQLLRQPDPNPYWVFAARRLDALGMKIQFAPRIAELYRDAYEHQAERGRAFERLETIAGPNGLLQDLRDSTTALKAEYKRLWDMENRPYYLENVLVRYDVLAQGYQRRIFAVQQAQRQLNLTRTIPSPAEIGF
jgi:hexosaminidase